MTEEKNAQSYTATMQPPASPGIGQAEIGTISLNKIKAGAITGADITGVQKIPDTLLWIDFETTGLDPEKDVLIEGAYVVTYWSDKANAHIPITQSSKIIYDTTDAYAEALKKILFTENGDSFIYQMHTKSGLKDVFMGLSFENASLLFYTPDQFMAELAEVAARHLQPKTPLAGSSVHFDRQWIYGEVLYQLSHRNLDVSAVKEALSFSGKEKLIHKEQQRRNQYWGTTPQTTNHRAMPDILESVDWLNWMIHEGLIGR